MFCIRYESTGQSKSSSAKTLNFIFAPSDFLAKVKLSPFNFLHFGYLAFLRFFMFILLIFAIILCVFSFFSALSGLKDLSRRIAGLRDRPFLSSTKPKEGH